MGKVHTAVKRALKAGVLKRTPCEVCGDEESIAHHDDYDRPLEVRWLCSEHHQEFHLMHREIRQPNHRADLTLPEDLWNTIEAARLIQRVPPTRADWLRYLLQEGIRQYYPDLITKLQLREEADE